MKIFKSPQRVLILFLSVLIVTSFIMILRLEGKAASLQTQWEEHQKSLKANKDVLQNLVVHAPDASLLHGLAREVRGRVGNSLGHGGADAVDVRLAVLAHSLCCPLGPGQGITHLL